MNNCIRITVEDVHEHGRQLHMNGYMGSDYFCIEISESFTISGETIEEITVSGQAIEEITPSSVQG